MEMISSSRFCEVEQVDVVLAKYNTVDDIIDFIDNWRAKNGIEYDVQLTDDEMEFLKNS